VMGGRARRREGEGLSLWELTGQLWTTEGPSSTPANSGSSAVERHPARRWAASGTCGRCGGTGVDDYICQCHHSFFDNTNQSVIGVTGDV
jgi:hypothetical protein